MTEIPLQSITASSQFQRVLFSLWPAKRMVPDMVSGSEWTWSSLPPTLRVTLLPIPVLIAVWTACASGMFEKMAVLSGLSLLQAMRCLRTPVVSPAPPAVGLSPASLKNRGG